MNDHYIDIHLRPDPELKSYQLLNALIARLHRALVQLKSEEIGISFPGYDERNPSLGTHLRLHGPATALTRLMNTSWLQGMQDHLRIGALEVAPAGSKHRVVSRVQAKSSVERLRRRAVKRHGITEEEAAQNIPETAAERLRLPFVTIGSRSTGQASFPLFIRHGPLLDQQVAGSFNSYGLSQEATIPWF